MALVHHWIPGQGLLAYIWYPVQCIHSYRAKMTGETFGRLEFNIFWKSIPNTNPHKILTKHSACWPDIVLAIEISLWSNDLPSLFQFNDLNSKVLFSTRLFTDCQICSQTEQLLLILIQYIQSRRFGWVRKRYIF